MPKQHWRDVEMTKNLYFVNITIERLDLSYEVETQWEGFPEDILLDVYIIPLEKRLLLEDFEEKVVKDFYKSSLCTMFEGTESYFENIRENIQDNWFGSDGIPKMVMTIDQYEKFLVKFETYKKEYNKLKNDIIAEYDQISESFKNGFKDAFPGAREIIIPSKEEYEQSFNMGIYPLKMNLEENRISQIYQEHTKQMSR